MNSNSNMKIWVGLIVVAIIAIGAYGFPRLQSSFGNLTLTSDTNYNKLGAVSLLVGTGCGDSNTPTTCNGTSGAANEVHGGVGLNFQKVAFSAGGAAASSTVCSFTSPSATSTIDFIQVQPTNLATTTVFVQIGTSTSATIPSGTSSPLIGFTSGAGTAVLASTSPVIVFDPGTGFSNTLPPSTLVNVAVQGPFTPGYFTGSCQIGLIAL